MFWTVVFYAPWGVQYHWPPQTSLSILLLVIYALRPSVGRGVCFNFNEEMKACAKQHNLPVPNDRQVGYDFGYGSLNETDEMCRTRGHTTVFQCMQRALGRKCSDSAEGRQLKFIWTFTLDTRRSEKAANYLCREHNLRIFRRHKEKCLRLQEHRAEICTQTKNATMAEVVTALRRESAQTYITPEVYLENLMVILSTYECKSIKAKLDCLFNLLRDTCHPDATLLILNYFKETLPPGCVYPPQYQEPPLPPVPLHPKYTKVFQQSQRHSQTPDLSKPQQHAQQQIMGDIPHGRYVNDGYYDESEFKSKPTSLAPPMHSVAILLLAELCLILTVFDV